MVRFLALAHCGSSVMNNYAEDTAADVVKKGRELQSEKIDQLLFRREDILHDLRSSFQSFADGIGVAVMVWTHQFMFCTFSLVCFQLKP